MSKVPFFDKTVGRILILMKLLPRESKEYFWSQLFSELTVNVDCLKRTVRRSSFFFIKKPFYRIKLCRHLLS